MPGYRSSARDENLLEQVLRQGEALRAAMIKTILRNEPFYEIQPNQSKRLTDEQHRDCDAKQTLGLQLSLPEKHACLAYMNGDPMTKDEEQQALDTFRSLSGSEICDLTSRSFSTTQNSCNCETCNAYGRINYNSAPTFVSPLSLKHVSGATTKSSSKVKFAQKQEYSQVLQFVNSLRIVLHSFAITNEGKTKLCKEYTDKQCSQKFMKFEDLNVTYFVEYEIPFALSRHDRKQSKVDCGLNNECNVKKCSKSCVKNVVYFKHATIHDLENVQIVNFEDLEIIIKISTRVLRQKKPLILGITKFNFSAFYNSPALSCLQELPVFLSENSPVITGSLKIHLELGCDKLYFGKEFIDCLQNKENRREADLKEVQLDDEEKLDETFTLDYKVKSPKKPSKPVLMTKERQIRKDNVIIAQNKTVIKESHPEKAVAKKKEEKITSKPVKTPNETKNKESNQENPILTTITEKTILFGFIFVSDVEYQHPHEKTHFTCQPFCQQDYVCSNATRGGRNVCFNYHQLIPYVYDEDFLFNLRENYMIIEFFSAAAYGGDEVVGICKVPLHQYYLAFRNPVIVKYLTRNDLPVIGTDWCEPIRDVVTGVAVGNAKVLVALGSEEQIRNLQKERGFMDDVVKRTRSVIKSDKSNEIVNTKDTTEKDKVVRNHPRKVNSPSPVKQKSRVKQVDKELQTDFIESEGYEVDLDTTPREVPQKIDKETIVTPSLAENKMADSNKSVNVIDDERLQTIQGYLRQLLEQQTNNSQSDNISNQIDENVTKAQSVNNMNVSVGQNGVGGLSPAANLFESLQDVVHVDNGTKRMFKAQIIIESALHLPARKKCRAKRVRGKIVREEMLPSTYVSFEVREGVVKTSQVVQKSTSPQWLFKNDVAVPLEYLVDSNRRLLVKVWRKSNNGSTIPNMQIDTILGFATIDLTVLLAGLPTIEGWFNIMDFTNKCNGQIKITVKPLEDISKYNTLSATNTQYTATPTPNSEVPSSPDETFNRALKRKFIELEEISQRLKTRLNHVTEDLPPIDALDESADEFEKDINTFCDDDEDDSIDFAKEAQDMNMRRVSSSLHQWQLGGHPVTQELMIATDQGDDTNSNSDGNRNAAKPEMVLQVAEKEGAPVQEASVNAMKTFVPEEPSQDDAERMTVSSSSSTSTLDKQLSEGRERIDHLLQRLTLLSSAQDKSESDGVAAFGSRYVSGCSATAANEGNWNVQDDIFHELGIDKEFNSSLLFDLPLGNFNGHLDKVLGRNTRDAPDGEGNSNESSNGDKQN